MRFQRNKPFPSLSSSLSINKLEHLSLPDYLAKSNILKYDQEPTFIVTPATNTLFITKKCKLRTKKFYCFETSSLDLTLLEAEKKKGKS
jgi:hypothetical protein